MITGSVRGNEALETDADLTIHWNFPVSECTFVEEHKSFVPASYAMTWDPQPEQNLVRCNQSKYILEWENNETSKWERWNSCLRSLIRLNSWEDVEIIS
ncbi:hypothetical protein WICPIJ_003200 [Wickerhamomyces pijperi]|uniref:Uncharacterized protein n=1 Tax=Wickerhamomyces pijperi TaxID=599730 RepID=A0A9P8Q8C9_WICPI|nr:hypothetical protein WICPIJ_003200 [Wickerhamomyces pijperi]